MMKLADILKKAYSCPYAGYMVICPVCNNRTCDPGEYVEHAKVMPDRCWVCGWQESNGTEMYPDDSDFLGKCWELQVAPYEELEMKDMGTVL